MAIKTATNRGPRSASMRSKAPQQVWLSTHIRIKKKSNAKLTNKNARKYTSVTSNLVNKPSYKIQYENSCSINRWHETRQKAIL